MSIEAATAAGIVTWINWLNGTILFIKGEAVPKAIGFVRLSEASPDQKNKWLAARRQRGLWALRRRR
jgi:hypothetical protein